MEMADLTVSRLLPFLAAITVGLLMVAVIAGAYFWHQKKRRLFTFSAKYLRQPSPARDYCSPNFYMTPSVTVETQLSLCALVDDNFRIQPYSIYKEEAWPYNVLDTSSNRTRSVTDSPLYETLSSPCLPNNNEILLQPDQLEDYEQEDYYFPSTQKLYHSDSLNSTVGYENITKDKTQECSTSDQQRQIKRKERQKQHTLHPCQTPIMLETNSNSPYVQIQSLHDFPDSSNDDCHSTIQLHQNKTSTKRKGGVVGAMKKCKDAGNKVIAKLPWRSSLNTTNRPSSLPLKLPSASSSSSSSSNRRLERPIRALRQSLKGLRGSIGHRRLRSLTSPHKPSNMQKGTILQPASDEERA